MSSVRNPILRTLHIPYELDQFVRLAHVDNNIRYPDELIKYVTSSIGQDIADMREFPRKFYSKSIAIPADIDDILTNKSRENKTHYNNVFIEYLILGVKNVKTEDRLLNMWIKELDKFLSELDSIHNIKNLNVELEELISKRTDLEAEVKNLSKEITNMRLLISEQQTKEYFREKLK